MLSAAGISMDTEKKALLESTLSLQERIEATQVALLVEQVILLSMIVQLETIIMLISSVMPHIINELH